MIIFIILIVTLIILAIVLSEPNKIDKKTSGEKQYNFSNYIKKDYIMTSTELNFYRNLKIITDEHELTIFPQVDLERIIKVKDNNSKDRNRIKSRSIDYTIVSNTNCKIICCIELDDYTHNYKNRIERDNFINELFSHTGIKLHRIKVNNTYNLEELEKIIKESL